ncbi:MAG: multicopper oxidase family protein [Solirubrobacterales bacterium]
MASDSQDSPGAGKDPMGGGISRRTVLRNALVGSGAGLIGVPFVCDLPGGNAATSAKPRPAGMPGMGPASANVPQTPPLKKFVDPLPIPATAIPDPSAYPGADYYDIAMRQSSWQFHRDLGPAKVWGYWAANPQDPQQPIGMGYLGPTISTTKDQPTVARYRNELPTTHPFQFAIDRLRSGDPQLTPKAPPPYKSMMPIPKGVNVWNVVHQHGGVTAPQNDGQPRHSYSPDGVHAGDYQTLDPSRVKPNEAIYAYTNRSRACMQWYHDHGWMMTSFNVYAGLAGLWFIYDRAEEPPGLPQGEFEVPLILQDRTFHTDGSLAYTMLAVQAADTPVVNGKAYPFLAVEPRRYRLRIINASNERAWRLQFSVPRDVSALPQPRMPFWLVGTDQGLRAPLQMLDIFLSPAERCDLIVDFGQLPIGTPVTLENYDAPVHYPGASGTGVEIPEIMQFRVNKPLSGGKDKALPPKRLKLPAVAPIKLKPNTRRRQWAVYEDHLFGTLTFNAVPFAAPVQDFVKAGSTEIWEYINFNHDAHPMHVHLVSFQVLNRQPINAFGYQTDYEKWLNGGRKDADEPVLEHYLTGLPVPPYPYEERSHKDTVFAEAEMVTRIVISEFEPPTETIASIPNSGTEFPAGYLHHCHILEHEDDDLMRPWNIVRGPAS